MSQSFETTRPRYVSTRTPMRLSFAGGGTDLISYAEEFGGEVLSAAINQYVYVSIKRHSTLFGERYRLNYSETEHAQHLDDINNGVIRECLRLVPVDDPINILVAADIPMSSGLGSSSSFAVGLLHGLHVLNGDAISPFQLAEEACFVEIEALNNPIGKQDQYAAAFGGLNHFEFQKNGRVTVDGLTSPDGFTQKVFRNLLLVWSGINRDASSILADQSVQIRDKLDAYHDLRKGVADCKRIFLSPDDNSLAKLGALLDRSWRTKKTLSTKISLDEIDEMYQYLKSCGALGCKLSGAGGGGFITAIIAEQNHDEVFSHYGVARVLKPRYEPRGSQVMAINY